MYLLDPKNGKPSVSLTLLMSGFIVATAKLIIADMSITEIIKFGAFTGSDYALVIGTLGALYWSRKHTDKNGKE